MEVGTLRCGRNNPGSSPGQLYSIRMAGMAAWVFSIIHSNLITGFNTKLPLLFKTTVRQYYCYSCRVCVCACVENTRATQVLAG